MTVARVNELADELGLHKRMAVGADGALPPFPGQVLGPVAVTFKDAVTRIWKWYREQLRHDVQFLTARAGSQQRSTLRAFDQLLDNQRHFNEHADFDRAADAQAWRNSLTTDGSEPSDRTMIAALIEELSGALDCLASIAGSVSRDDAGADAWRNHVQRTPQSEVRAVLADIGKESLSATRVEAIVRRFTGHPKLRTARTPGERTRIAAVVVMEMNLDPLSLPHDQILDEFGLVGNSLGQALLIVAHGVEAAGHRGGNLLAVLRRTWPEVRGARASP